MSVHFRHFYDERKPAVSSCAGAQVLYYHRHADGIICCFQKSYDADMFFLYLNKCHPNIKFRMETETDGKLPFLDVLFK